MAYGFPVEDPGRGSAEGYIGEDHQFYGVLHFGKKNLHRFYVIQFEKHRF